MENISKFFHGTQVHEKLDFLEIEFQKSGRLLNISQIVVNCIIFSKKVVFGHFGQKFK